MPITVPKGVSTVSSAAARAEQEDLLYRESIGGEWPSLASVMVDSEAQARAPSIIGEDFIMARYRCYTGMMIFAEY